VVQAGLDKNSNNNSNKNNNLNNSFSRQKLDLWISKAYHYLGLSQCSLTGDNSNEQVDGSQKEPRAILKKSK
jgi:hypothetical protein